MRSGRRGRRWRLLRRACEAAPRRGVHRWTGIARRPASMRRPPHTQGRRRRRDPRPRRVARALAVSASGPRIRSRTRSCAAASIRRNTVGPMAAPSHGNRAARRTAAGVQGTVGADQDARARRRNPIGRPDQVVEQPGTVVRERLGIGLGQPRGPSLAERKSPLDCVPEMSRALLQERSANRQSEYRQPGRGCESTASIGCTTNSRVSFSPTMYDRRTVPSSSASRVSSRSSARGCCNDARRGDALRMLAAMASPLSRSCRSLARSATLCVSSVVVLSVSLVQSRSALFARRSRWNRAAARARSRIALREQRAERLGPRPLQELKRLRTPALVHQEGGVIKVQRVAPG